MTSRLRPLLLLPLLALALGAQSLSVNGVSTPVDAFLGQTFSTSLSGNPGSGHLWAFDLSPGPVTVGGLTIPLGLTSALVEIGGGAPLPPSGTRTISFVPTNPADTGFWFHSVGAILDSAAPYGFLLSNPGSFRFLAQGTDAGPDAATFVGEGVVLDGSAQAPGGLPQPGLGLSWSLVSAPTGSSATLFGETTAFPGFVPDLPGRYVFELQTQGPGGIGIDQMEVAAFSITPTTPAPGSFGVTSGGVVGSILGPPLAAVTVDGQPTALLGSTYLNLSAVHGSEINDFGVRAELGDGRFVTRSSVSQAQPGAPLGTPCNCLSLRFNQPALDSLETQIEPVVGGIDFNALVQAIPTQTVVNNAPWASAILNPTSGSFDPNNIDVQITPRANDLLLTVTLHNVVVNANVSGELVFVNYSETATITASTAVISASFTIGTAPSGAVQVDLSGVNATLQGFSYTMSGVLNTLAQISLVQDALRSGVEDAIENSEPQIEAAINPLLQDLVLSTDLSSSGIPLALDFPLAATEYDTSGVTFRNALLAAGQGSSSSAPALSHYRSVSTPAPVFPALTPNGASYGLGVSFDENMLNQILAELTTTGLFDLDLSGSIGSGSQTIPLVAQAMAFVIPFAGFEKLPPTTPITLRMRHSIAPLIAFTPAGPDLGRLHLGGVRLDFLAELTPGVQTPVISLGLRGGAGLDLGVDPLTNTLSVALVPGSVTATPYVRHAFPGTDPTPLLGTFPQVIELLLPSITGVLNSIPVPNTPLGTPQVLGVDPLGAHALGSWWNL